MKLRLPEPALTCGGATLREWQAGDEAALLEAWSDAEIARWNPVPKLPTADLAASWVSRYHARLADGSALDLVLVDHETATVVGEVGIAGIDHARRAAHIGYWLLPAARGRGIASRAVDVVSSWLIGDLGLSMLVARCAVANTASQRVARAAGYTHASDDDRGHQLWLRKALAAGESSP